MLFTNDAEVDYAGDDYRYHGEGRDAARAFLRQAFTSDIVAAHIVHEPIVTVAEGGLTAEGQFTLQDYYTRSTNVAVEGLAVYGDLFEKHAGEWLVRRVAYTRLYAMEFDERPHRHLPPAGAQADRLTVASRGITAERLPGSWTEKFSSDSGEQFHACTSFVVRAAAGGRDCVVRGRVAERGAAMQSGVGRTAVKRLYDR